MHAMEGHQLWRFEVDEKVETMEVGVQARKIEVLTSSARAMPYDVRSDGTVRARPDQVLSVIEHVDMDVVRLKGGNKRSHELMSMQVRSLVDQLVAAILKRCEGVA